MNYISFYVERERGIYITAAFDRVNGKYEIKSNYSKEVTSSKLQGFHIIYTQP